MLGMDGLLHWISASLPGFVPPNFISHSSITIITPPTHSALHIRDSCYPGGTPLFPANTSCCHSNSILIHRKLTSQFESFRYHKSNPTTLEFIFGYSPGSNVSEIQGVPPASLRNWWIVCFCIRRLWCEGRLNGWHWDYVRLLRFDCLAGLLFLVYLLSFLNQKSFSFVLFNIAMGTVEYWMRCWEL